MEKIFDVLTFGDLCVDLIVDGRNTVPELGQKEKLVDNYSLEMGGSCSIFACQCGKLGLHTVLVGKVGMDQFGKVIEKTLVESGVNNRFITMDPALKTGMTIVFNQGDDRGMLTYSGTIDSVGIEDAPEELLLATRHLHIGSYFLMTKMQPRYKEIIEIMKKNGATVSLDTNWDPEENWDNGLWELLPLIDVFFPNENEAKAITRETSMEKAVEKLTDIVPIVVVKQGADGATAYFEGRTIQAPSIAVEMMDAIGAGDSFDAGFLYGYLNGKDVEECMRIGCICGSLNTRKTGGTKGQPSLEEVYRYLSA